MQEDKKEEVVEKSSEEEAKVNNESEEITEDDFKDETEVEPKKKQSQEENARYAEKRRKEREELQKKAYAQGQIDSLKENPYTHEPIEDEVDLKIFKIQRQIEEEGGNPINDLAKRLAKIEREEKIKAQHELELQTESQKKVHEDALEFRRAFKLSAKEAQEIYSDSDFQEFASGKIGVIPLKDIYEKYQNFLKKHEIKKEEKPKPKVPSANNSGTPVTKSVKDMSDEEFIAYRKKQGKTF